MKRFIAIAALSLLPLAGHALELGGVDVPTTASVGGRQLMLNGAGVRQKFFFNIYVAAIYLPSRANVASEVLALPGPERITMVLLRDVTAQQLIDALETGVRHNHTEAQVEALRARLDALNAVMNGIKSARSGSAITMDYLPGAGTQVGLDGSSRGSLIAGDDFYRALLLIWLGDDPADPGLKKALLGGS